MLISPILTLIGVLKSKDRQYVRWMLTIFATVYASTFSIEGIGDGTRHWQRVYDYYVGLSFPTFWSDLGDIVFFRTNDYVNEDVYIHLISYFTGGLLGLPQLFFVVVGFIYGYFFAGSMLKVFRYFPSPRRHFPYFIIAVYFITILNLQSMNTVRTWTGFWVMFYGTLQYQDTKRLKYLLLILAAPLFHVGYFIMAIPTWIVTFLPLKRYWIAIVYILSFSSSFISPQSAVSQLQQLEVGQEKVKGYYVEEKATVGERVEQFSQGGKARWYRVYRKSGVMEWAVVLISLVFLLNGDYLKRMNDLESLLFSAGLASKVLSNTAWFLYAVSNRSATIGDLFILAAIVIYWQRHYAAGVNIRIHPTLKPIFYASIFLIIPGFFYFLSNNLEYLSAYVLFLPEIAWFSEEARISIRGFIGILLDI